MDVNLKLVCGNCGTSTLYGADTATEAFEQAFKDGWDTIERFGYNACPKCPGVAVYFPMMFAQQARMQEQPAAREKLLKEAAAHTIGPPEGGTWPVFEEKSREA